ncbi:MAG: GAF domain-containing protein [Anaerolineae bacterium]|nr:GAF domain-containing protein [Anaerolineae bacterium]
METIGRASPLPFDLDGYLLATLQRVQGLMPFDSGGLALFNAASNTLVSHAYLGGAALPVPSTPLGEGIIGQVGASGVPLIVNDMRADARCALTDPRSRAEMAVPLLLDGQLIGVFHVESYEPGAYNEAHLAVLQAIADQMALIIDTACKYRALAEQHNALFDGLSARQRESDTLRRLTSITSSTVDLDEMLTHALREAAQLLDCEGAQVLLPDLATYQLIAHEPSQFGLVRAWGPALWALDGPGHPVDVYHRGAAYVSASPDADAGPGCRNLLACPLNTRNRTLGVLRLVNRRAGPFGEAEIAIGQAIASQIAVSLSSAQMLAAEQRRTTLLNQINRVSQDLYAMLDPDVLLCKTAQHILDVFAPDAVHIFLLGADRCTAHLQATATRAAGLHFPDDLLLPVSAGLIGRAIRAGQTQLADGVEARDVFGEAWIEVEGLQSCLIAPLRRADETSGAIALVSTAVGAFSEIERDALETLATQVSTALENAQFYHQAQRRLVEQGVVHQIGQDLTAILNYNDLPQVMVAHMNRALNTSRCQVALYMPEHDAVRVEADFSAPHLGDSGDSGRTGQHLRLAEHTAIAGAIRTRQPVTVYAQDGAAPSEAAARLLENGEYSQLVVPIVTAKRVLGVVDWTDNQPGRRFSPEDIRLAQTLVAQAAIAIDNALMFRELEQRADELAEANRLRSQFLATISHELRTPMNSIIGFSETLLDGLYGELNERQASRMERIKHNAYALLALIDDLLDLSRIDAGRLKLHPETVSLNTAVETAVQAISDEAAAKGLALTLELAEDLPRIQADPERLYQVVMNLLSNAIKFTPQGGVTIITGQTERQDRRFVQATVTDTGIGISQTDQAIIFDEFRQADGSSTRSYAGTGLGLAICKKLVEMMGGSIWVRSAPGEGSTFAFALPVPDAPASE